MTGYKQEIFDLLFDQLAEKFDSESGWEARQGDSSYLHVSKPTWGDEEMNGIHLETYVLDDQLAKRTAPVAIHCEAGCPFRCVFMKKVRLGLDLGLVGRFVTFFFFYENIEVD